MNHPSYCHIVVLISGSGSNLQALIDASTTANFKISAVISNNQEAYGLHRAEKNNIPVQVIDHRCFETREDFDLILRKTIEEINPNLIVLAGFMRILGSNFVNHFSGRILNIHPSLLPKYPGINTHQRALDGEEQEHGVTVHFVTEALDGGPIIAQMKVPVLEEDTPDILAARVLNREHIIYPKTVAWFGAGRLRMEGTRAILDGEPLPPTGVQIKYETIP